MKCAAIGISSLRPMAPQAAPPSARMPSFTPRCWRWRSDQLPPGGRPSAFVQMVRGQLSLNGKNLSAGDGAKIADESELQFLAAEEAEFLLFDLPPQA
jgi:redox-sensitive bicupin YhaK (pirin superfamily)